MWLIFLIKLVSFKFSMDNTERNDVKLQRVASFTSVPQLSVNSGVIKTESNDDICKPDGTIIITKTSSCPQPDFTLRRESSSAVPNCEPTFILAKAEPSFDIPKQEERDPDPDSSETEVSHPYTNLPQISDPLAELEFLFNEEKLINEATRTQQTTTKSPDLCVQKFPSTRTGFSPSLTPASRNSVASVTVLPSPSTHIQKKFQLFLVKEKSLVLKKQIAVVQNTSKLVSVSKPSQGTSNIEPLSEPELLNLVGAARAQKMLRSSTPVVRKVLQVVGVEKPKAIQPSPVVVSTSTLSTSPDEDIGDTFYCVMCPLKPNSFSNTFANYNHIEQHFINSHNCIIKCIICKVPYRGVIELKEHLTDVHQTTQENTLKLFILAALTNEHCIVKTPFVNMACLLCYKNHRTYAETDKHMKYSHVLYCRPCGILFKDTKDFTLHLKRHQSGEIYFLQCNICGYMAKSAHDGKQHETSQHPTSKSPVMFVMLKQYDTYGRFYPGKNCVYCNVELSEDESLFNHIHSHVKLQCKMCSRIFVSKKNDVGDMRCFLCEISTKLPLKISPVLKRLAPADASQVDSDKPIPEKISNIIKEPESNSSVPCIDLE